MDPKRKLSDTVCDVRSFLNQSDFYYVEQEVDVLGLRPANLVGIWISQAANQIYSMTADGAPDERLRSTTCTESTTSGVSWNIGGSAGWNVKQIAQTPPSPGASAFRIRRP